MRRILIISAIILALGTLAHAQTMIGLSKEEVTVKMKKEHRKFRKDNSVVKQRFNYLKYVNGLRTRTWIIYFTDEDICRTHKLVCDYSDYDEMLEGLDEKYSKSGDLLWEYVAGPDTIQVELIKQEWYFTIRESRKQATDGKAD